MPHTEVLTHRNRQTLSMNFGSALLQSCMQLDDPTALLLEYTRAMMACLLVQADPAKALMVGLGGGSIPKYCHQHLSKTHVTVLEISPEVIALRDEFLIPHDDDRLTIHCVDGAAFMRHSTALFDIIWVDGFAADGQVPELCSAAFYRHCAARLTPQGVLVVNLHAKNTQLSTWLKRMGQAMPAPVLQVPVDDGDNIIALCSPMRNWPASKAQFDARWQALASTHQATLSDSITPLQHALAPYWR